MSSIRCQLLLNRDEGALGGTGAPRSLVFTLSTVVDGLCYHICQVLLESELGDHCLKGRKKRENQRIRGAPQANPRGRSGSQHYVLRSHRLPEPLEPRGFLAIANFSLHWAISLTCLTNAPGDFVCLFLSLGDRYHSIVKAVFKIIAIRQPQPHECSVTVLFLCTGYFRRLHISCEMCECDLENSHFLNGKTRLTGSGRIQPKAPLTPPREQRPETFTLSFIIPATASVRLETPTYVPWSAWIKGGIHWKRQTFKGVSQADSGLGFSLPVPWKPQSFL